MRDPGLLTKEKRQGRLEGVGSLEPRGERQGLWVYSNGFEKIFRLIEIMFRLILRLIEKTFRL